MSYNDFERDELNGFDNDVEFNYNDFEDEDDDTDTAFSFNNDLDEGFEAEADEELEEPTAELEEEAVEEAVEEEVLSAESNDEAEEDFVADVEDEPAAAVEEEEVEEETEEAEAVEEVESVQEEAPAAEAEDELLEVEEETSEEEEDDVVLDEEPAALFEAQEEDDSDYEELVLGGSSQASQEENDMDFEDTLVENETSYDYGLEEVAEEVVEDTFDAADLSAKDIVKSVVTAEEVAKMYGPKAKAVKKAAKKGKIPARKSAGTYLLLKSDAKSTWKKKGKKAKVKTIEARGEHTLLDEVVTYEEAADLYEVKKKKALKVAKKGKVTSRKARGAYLMALAEVDEYYSAVEAEGETVVE